MADILEILGKNATSPGVAKVLAAYPDLEGHEEELGPGQDPVRYLSSESDGLRIKLSSEGRVLAVFLMAEGKDGCSQFHGALPGGLTFRATRREALQAFGAPAFVRAGGRFGSFEVGELMRFDWAAHSVHFQFRRDGAGIELVTAMVADVVPGRGKVE